MVKLSLQKRLSYYVTAIVALIFIVTMAAVSYGTMQHSLSTASHEAELEVDNTASLINARLDAVKAAIDNAAIVVQRNMRFNNVDSLQGIVESVVTENPGIMGSAIAFQPDVFPKERGQLMMYAYKDLWKNVISKRLGGNLDYNYTQMEWFADPMKNGKCRWSEPYFDHGAGETKMCTYSHPILADGRVIGVITGDITLLDIKDIIKETGIDDTPGRVVILSRNKSELYSDGVSLDADSQGLSFTADVPSTGWTIEKVIPYSQLMAPMWNVMKLMIVLCLFTLVVLFLAINYAVRKLSQPEVDRQARLDTELSIASHIQNGMLPKHTHTDNVTAVLKAAKEVSGDISKFLAERAVLEATARGEIVGKVVRLGNLAPRERDGEFQINFRTNSFMNRLKSTALLGCYPYSMYDSSMDISPIDEVARAIVLFAQTPETCVLFHGNNANRYRLGNFYHEAALSGLHIRPVEDEEYAASLEAAKNDPEKMGALVGLMAYEGMGAGLKPVDYTNQYSNQVLLRMGFHWPVVSSGYVEKLISAISELGFFIFS